VYTLCSSAYRRMLMPALRTHCRHSQPIVFYPSLRRVVRYAPYRTLSGRQQ